MYMCMNKRFEGVLEAKRREEKRDRDRERDKGVGLENREWRVESGE